MAVGGSHYTVEEAEFECAICMECYSDPFQVFPCEHSFCKDCLTRLRESTDFKCPKCRQQIQQCFPDEVMTARLVSCHIVCGDCRLNVIPLYMKQHRLVCPGTPALPKHNPAGASCSHSSTPNRATFKCPYCDQANLTCSQLLDHCNSLHKSSQKQVVCPVCASMPWGDPNRKSSNFISHLNMRHSFEYDTYVDFDQDDDAMLRAAISASLQQT